MSFDRLYGIALSRTEQIGQAVAADKIGRLAVEHNGYTTVFPQTDLSHPVSTFTPSLCQGPPVRFPSCQACFHIDSLFVDLPFSAAFVNKC